MIEGQQKLLAQKLDYVKMCKLEKHEKLDMNTVNKKITAMDSEIKDLYQLKIIQFVEPKIVKFQKLFRRVMERQRIKANIKNLLQISRMVKKFQQLEFIFGWKEFKQRA